jgi:two-component system response regulator HydG
VGKDLAARAIHSLSPRRHKPFIKIICGTFNEHLLDSELFGHRKGAFTGAAIENIGLIEAANGGTFFFDEIGDMDMTIQAKLLSVIEDKEVRRVGDIRYRKIDVRFIFATNQDLAYLMTMRRFREDLYFRINTLSFNISPLRERKEDIPLMIKILMERCEKKATEDYSISENAINALCTYDYPGNVRELENILKRARELSRSRIIMREDIVFERELRARSINAIDSSATMNIYEALRRCNGNKTEAAKLLGISRVHLYRLLGSNMI